MMTDKVGRGGFYETKEAMPQQMMAHKEDGIIDQLDALEKTICIAEEEMTQMHQLLAPMLREQNPQCDQTVVCDGVSESNGAVLNRLHLMRQHLWRVIESARNISNRVQL